MQDKRFWDGLLYCPLWTNYHSFLSNLIQPCYGAKFRAGGLSNYTTIVKLEVRTKQKNKKVQEYFHTILVRKQVIAFILNL